MKCTLTQNNGSNRLILIFAGWSTDPSFYSGIHIEGYDVMVAWDYSDLSFPTDKLEPYSSISLFAWSLGVFAASVSLPFRKLALAVAVNGTVRPVDDAVGIPSKIFQDTMEHLNERNLLKFRKRMAGKLFDEYAPKFPACCIDDLKIQLATIADSNGTACNDNVDNVWDMVVISSEDRIFPPANMLRAWESEKEHAEIRIVNEPHLANLKEIISAAIPQSEKLSCRFKKSASSYDDNACVQADLAMRLCNTIPEDTAYDNVLEIGPGTGLLTKSLGQRFRIDQMDFVDLYETPVFGVAGKECYYCADAEKWLSESLGSKESAYDLIATASAMQWFVNPKDFIVNCRRLLKKGGVFACSTFLPGTMAEIRETNPYGIVYRTRKRLEAFLSPYFNEILMEEKDYCMDFKSSRETLRHLISTGVGGSASTPLTTSQLLATFPRKLTYKTLIIVAR